MHLSVALALTLLLQTAAVTPTPAPEPTLAPTPTPVARGLVLPRTLQDVARERRLKTSADAKGTPREITVGPGAAATNGATPGATPATSPTAAGEVQVDGTSSAADVRVVAVSNDGIVDATGGVRVTGAIRNAGYQMLCGIVILVRILDSRGAYLSSSQISPDVTILPSGETTSFHTTVQAPPGIRGARINPDRRDVTDGSTSMAGDWKLLGGAEAKVVDAAPCPK